MNDRAKLILQVMLDHLPVRQGIGPAGCGFVSTLGHFVQEHQAIEVDRVLALEEAL